jgi:hypothetical protein
LRTNQWFIESFAREVSNKQFGTPGVDVRLELLKLYLTPHHVLPCDSPGYSLARGSRNVRLSCFDIDTEPRMVENLNTFSRLTNRVPKTVSQEKAAEIAADWVTVFYNVPAGVIETQEFITSPIPHWLFCFSDTLRGPMQRMLFVVLLPTGIVVQPKIAERL